MVEVQLTKSKNDNPFYGMKSTLRLFQNVGNDISVDMLNSAYAEAKTKAQKDLFFSLLFSIGDVTSRQHNIFDGVTKDNGGNANRESFYTIFNWMKDNHREQFIRFLNAGLFNEYSCFDMLFRSRVKTKGGKVLKVYDIFADDWYRHALVEYVYAVINGTNPFNKFLVAKFLTIPRMTKRSGHGRMLPETKMVMEHKGLFLKELSALMGWEYDIHGSYANFVGYRKWRKEYNQNLESVLFSSGKILDFTKDEFINWFDKLPATARFRVKNRILYKINDDGTPKYANLEKWYVEWEQYKEKKQAEQRVLEEKIRQGNANADDVAKLQKVKKEAKVTTGATNFKEIYDDILRGRVDELKVESFMNKVNLPYNSLVIIDDSGSMTGAPFNFATFMASICLVKNPDDDGRNLLGFFNDYSRLYGYIDQKATKMPNSLLRRGSTKTVSAPFVDPNKSFIQNYKNIDSFCRAVFQSGCTNISSIPEGFKRCIDNDPSIKDAIMNYPIWTIISDGEWNNMHSPEASMNDFMRKCEMWFGFKPFIVAIDISKYTLHNDANRFAGIDNMVYIPSNPVLIEQFLMNFNDMDVYDIYAPLQSIYRSNRYDIVRENVL